MNHKDFLKPDWNNKIYILVSDHRPIAHKAENIIKAFADESEANKRARELKAEDNIYENVVVAMVEFKK